LRDTKIDLIRQEASNIRSFFFKDELSLSTAQPGQFVMVWLPGAGEFPMSLSLPLEKRRLASIGVKAMGTGSEKLYRSKKGDYLGIRGPYGRPFDLGRSTTARKKVLLVGGGTGMVPMIVLARSLSKLCRKVSIVIAARTQAELPFVQSARKIVGSKNVFLTTDDGSAGFKGLAHQKVEQLLSEEGYGEIFSCGPEKMMAKVFELARKNELPVQFSLERIMKCGIGICGSCTIGDLVLCKDGPVLNEKELASIRSEFGKSHRDKTGTMGPF
jgi:dihydroorotate dehydrogenase electron transfer subunit